MSRRDGSAQAHQACFFFCTRRARPCSFVPAGRPRRTDPCSSSAASPGGPGLPSLARAGVCSRGCLRPAPALPLRRSPAAQALARFCPIMLPAFFPPPGLPFPVAAPERPGLGWARFPPGLSAPARSCAGQSASGPVLRVPADGLGERPGRGGPTDWDSPRASISNCPVNERCLPATIGTRGERSLQFSSPPAAGTAAAMGRTPPLRDRDSAQLPRTLASGHPALCDAASDVARTKPSALESLIHFRKSQLDVKAALNLCILKYGAHDSHTGPLPSRITWASLSASACDLETIALIRTPGQGTK
jgi:hypothetical protein